MEAVEAIWNHAVRPFYSVLFAMSAFIGLKVILAGEPAEGLVSIADIGGLSVKGNMANPRLAFAMGLVGMTLIALDIKYDDKKLRE